MSPGATAPVATCPLGSPAINYPCLQPAVARVSSDPVHQGAKATGQLPTLAVLSPSPKFWGRQHSRLREFSHVKGGNLYVENIVVFSFPPNTRPQASSKALQKDVLHQPSVRASQPLSPQHVPCSSGYPHHPFRSSSRNSNMQLPQPLSPCSHVACCL